MVNVVNAAFTKPVRSPGNRPKTFTTFLPNIHPFHEVTRVLLKNDGNPISLQERACKETTYPKKRQICEPIVLDELATICMCFNACVCILLHIFAISAKRRILNIWVVKMTSL